LRIRLRLNRSALLTAEEQIKDPLRLTPSILGSPSRAVEGRGPTTPPQPACSKVRTPRDGGSVSTIPPVKPCGLFLPGHDVHWIQVMHAGRDPENRPVR